MKFLVFQHVEHETPGLILEYCKEQGIELNVLELWKPYVMPAAEGFDAVILLGGPMGAYEDYPSRDYEVKFIKDNIGKLPILGLCLGAQLLAYALGAKVYKNHKKEIGYYSDVELTEDGKADGLFKNFASPMTVLQWHGDTFDLPDGARLLATAPDCKHQAFKFKNAYGLQYHVEFTPEMVNKLMEVDREWIHKDFEIDEIKFAEDAQKYADLMQKQCKMLMDNFVEQIAAVDK